MFKIIKERFSKNKRLAKKQPEILRYEELEQRVLFSADVVPGLDTAAVEEQVIVQDVSSEVRADREAAPETVEQTAEEPRSELVLVNENVVDYEQLITDLKGSDNNRVIEVVVLESDRDGIQQVSEILAERSDLAAVHFITHGTDGQVNLGNSKLTSTTLEENSDAVADWGKALTETGDILFYGCNIAADNDGQNLLNDIAELTGTDVKASDDFTGSAELGGDWELEYQAGDIESTVAFSAQIQQHWAGLLADNLAPVNSVPGNQTTAENTTLEFSSTIGNVITVSDPDADGEEVEVTLKVTNGTLTLPSGPSDETLAKTVVTGTQNYSDIAVAADGSFVVTWTDSALDGAAAGIFMQRFAVDGTAIGSETQVNTYTTGSQEYSAVAMDDAGNFVVTWESFAQDGDGDGIYAQRFNSDGVKQGSEFLVNTLYTTSYQWRPDVAMHSTTGDFTIIWEDNGVDGIYMKRFSSDGTVLIGDTAVTTGSANYAAIATSEAGDMVIVWQASDSALNGVWGQRYDEFGSAVGGNFLINTYETSAQDLADIAMDAEGNFVVVWQSSMQDGDNDGIYAQRYDSDGVKQGSEFLVNTRVTDNYQGYAAVAMEAGGDFVITWHCASLDGSGYGISAKKYDSDGNVLIEDFQVNTTTYNSQSYPAVSSCDKGFVISWHGVGDTENGVFFRSYFESGLTFSEGDGVDDATMTFTGTIADINTALDGLIYTPTPSYTGSDTLEITTDDQGFTGSGGAQNDYDTVAINVVSGSSVPPVVTLPGSAVNYAPNDPAVIIDATATVTDSDSSDFENGTLTVDFTAGATVNDRLAIRSEGTGVGQISTSKTLSDGWIVKYGGTTIGTFTGGTYGFTPLVITLNAVADEAATQALLRNITYENVSDTPDETARTVRFVLADGDGGTSAAVTETINITAVNDAPTFWDYHHTIDLDSPTVTADYPIKLELTEGVNGFNHANAQPNGEDLRFYDAAGNELSYWIEDWNSGGASTIWVEVATPGTTNIEMYYGNANVASASDPNATFLFYDDFEDDLIGTLPTGWTLAQNAPLPTPPSIQNDAGNLVFSDGANGGGPVVSTGDWADVSVSQDFRTINPGDLISHAGLIARYTDVDNMVYGGIIDKDTAQIWYRNGGTFTQIGGDWSITALNVDDANWHNQELRLNGDTVELYIDDTFIGSADLTATGAPASGQTGYWSQYSNYEAYRDNHIVRSYDGGTGDIATTVANEGYAIDENSPNGTVVGNVLATDPDLADVLTYNITAGNTGSAFDIDNNGQITVNNSAVLDFETTPSFTLTVQVADGNGGTDTDTVTIILNDVNDAPTAANKTVTTNEDTTYTFTAADFNFSDVDGDTLASVKITGLETVGSLQLSGGDVALNQVISKADIDAGNLKFVPIANANGAGYDSFGFSVNDGSTDSASSYTMTIDVTAVNDAPLLNAGRSPALNAINEDAGMPSGAVGTLISQLVDFMAPAGQVDNVYDPDAGAQLGIAVTSAVTTNGTWWYSTNNGTNWNSLGVVTFANARLLAADADTRICFQPNANYNGTLASAITFRAWDQTSGSNGALANTLTNGGTTAFSMSADTASLVINAVNDAPTVDLNGSDGGGTNFTTTFTEDGGAVNVTDADAIITDVDDTTYQSLSVNLTNISDGADERIVMAGYTFTYGTTEMVVRTVGSTDFYLDFDGSGFNVMRDGGGTIPLSDLQTLMRGIAYENISQDPTAGDRVIQFIAQDGSGLLGPIATSTITVNPVNDAPTLSVTNATPTFTENGGAVSLFSGTSVDAVEAGDLIDTLQITVDGIADGSNEILVVDGQDIELTHLNNETTATNSYDVSVNVSGSTATVVITKTGGFSAATAETLVDGLAYNNTSENPQGAVRMVNLISIKDDGGTTNGGADTAGIGVSSLVTISAVNDDPTNTGSLPTDVAVTEDVTSSVDLSTVNFSDVDAGNNLITVTLNTSTGGKIWASSDFDVTVFGSGTGTLTLIGGVADLNNFFSSASRFQYLHGTPHTAGDNADTIQVEVNDGGNTGSGGGGTINLGTVNVDITPVNDTPTTVGIADVTVDEDAANTVVDLFAAFADVEDLDPALTYTITNNTNPGLFSSTKIDGVAGSLTLDYAANQNGAADITVRATDTGGQFVETTFTVAVNPVNDTPTTSGIADITVDEDAANTVVDLFAAFADVEDLDPALTYTITNNTNPGLFTSTNIDGVAGSLTLDYAPNAYGTAGITVRATDTGGQFVETTFTVTVNPVNDTPTTSGIADITVDEDAANTVVDLFAAFADVEDLDPALTYTITNNTNPGLFTATTIDGVAGSLTLNYAADQNGAAAITVRATDTGGQFVETTFTVTVNSVNDTPTTSGIADVTVDEDAADSVVDLFAAFADVEDLDSALTYTITNNTNPGLFTATTIDGVAGSLTLNYAAAQNGAADITIRATDTGGQFVETTFTVAVNPINDTPTTVGIADVTVDEDAADTVVDLFAAFADAEDLDPALTYTITGNTNPGLFTATTIDGVAGSLTLDYAADQNGAADITVRATDTGGQFVETTFTVTVNPVNDTPTTVGIADITVDEDAADSVVDLFAAFADVEDLDPAMTYTITNNTNPGLFTSTTIDGVAGSLTLNYAADQDGSSDITVRATDTGGQFVETTFTVTVNAVNDIPTTVGIADVTVDEDAADSVVDLFAAFADVEDLDSALTCTITNNTNPGLFTSTTIDGVAGSLTLNYAADQNGSSVITVRATDTGGQFVETTFTVTVNSVNDTPTTSGIADVTVDEDAADSVVDLFAAFADVEDLDPALTYTITNNTNPGLFTSTNIDGVAGSLTLDYAPNAYGTAGITVRATDTGGQFVETTFTVTVNPVNDTPTTSGIADITVDEDAADSVVDLFAAFADVEDLDPALTYTITNNTNPGLFTSTTIDGVAGSLTLDYAANQNGTANITVRATDTGGQFVETTFTVTVNPVNDAPVIGGANDLTTINEDPVSNDGTLVSDLIAGQITDSDAAALSGIAVTAVDDTNGTWQYTTNSGGLWTDFASPSESTARLLAADASTYIRFVPNADWNGTVTNGISFRAWDQTSGSAGGTVDFTRTVRDEFTMAAYSNNDGTANWATEWIETDTSDNIKVSGQQLVMTPINMGDSIYRQADLTGATSATLSFDYTNGLAGAKRIELQISDNGGSSFTTLATFSDVINFGSGSFSTDISSYVAANTQIRFYFTGSSNGVHSLSVDNVQIQYAANDVVGGTTAFSTATASSSIAVNPINDTPTTVGIADITVDEDAADSVVDLFAAFADVEDLDPALTFTITGNTNPGLFTSTTIDGVAGSLTLDYAANQNGSSDITVRATDTGGEFVETTFTVTVNPINDTPTTVGIADITVAEDAADSVVDLFAAFADVEDLDSALTYTITNNTNPGLFTATTIDSVAGSLTLDYAANQNGAAEITVRTTDTGGQFVETTFTVTVNSVNDTPTTSGIADVTVAEDAADSVVDLFAAFADVEDLDSALTYTITNNTNPGLFTATTIDGVAGSLTLDYAANQNGSSDITVRATDTGGQFVETTFTVTVNPVNDTPTTSGIADITVAEDAADSVVDLFTAFADVEDLDSALTYTITNNTNPGLFTSTAIDGVAGSLTLKYAANQNGAADITVRATDTGGLFVETTFTVTVNPVNDTPTTVGIADINVDEDAADSVVDLFAAFADVEDLDPALTYSITNNTNPGLFTSTAIDGVAGSLTLDYAAAQNGSSDITVRATDTGGQFVETTFTVTVNPVNDTPTTSGIADITVDEDAADSVVDLFAAFADVEDLNTALTYTITNNTNPGLFTSTTIDGVAGSLTLDYAANQNGSSDVTVRATDTGGQFVETTFTVTVNPVNDIPTTVGIADITVDEDAADSVVDLFAAFADVEDLDPALTFTITGNTNPGLFTSTTIDGVAGSLTLDYAANQNGSSDITVRATDTGGEFVETTFTVTVNPINDTPTTVGIADITVAEDAADSVVDLFAAFADVEDLDSALTYTITNNTNPGLFTATTIDSVAGSLTLDYAANQNGAAEITVRTTDTGGQFVETTFTVTVNSVNDTPTTVGIADVTVAEDAADSVVDLFAAFSDVEDLDPTLTYTITNNTNPGLFASTTIDGVAGSLTLDYAAAQNGSADITVRATDTGGQFVETTFTVTVNPVNDTPTTVGIADVTVDEDAADSVVDLFAAFADVEDLDPALTYTITNNTNPGLFTATTIDGVAGSLTLDYAANQNGAADITVRATDTGGLWVETTFTVTVNPVNDTPTTVGIADITVAEDAADSVVDLFAAFADVEDLDSALTYTITNNTNPGLFTSTTIDGVAGSLTLDYAANQNGTADITVRATDTGGLFVETTFTVTVNAVNDTPTAVGIADITVAEDAADSVVDLFAAFADVEDLDSALTYTITNNTNPGLFTSTTIDGVAGSLTLNYAADQNGSSDITVRATDTGGQFVETTFTVTVNPVNDIPTTSGIADITVAEDAADSVVDLFAAFADIEDLDPALTYTITNNTNPGLFTATTIDGVAGSLTLNYAADQNGAADITVRATDTGGQFVETTFTVTVNPVNDAPTIAAAIADQNLAEDFASYTIDLNAAFDDVETTDANLVYGVSGNTNINVSITAGIATITPSADWNGSETLTFSATDTGGLSVSQNVVFAVSAVADIAADTAVSVTEDTPTVIAVLANDSFEGSPVVTATTAPANGAVVINGDNTITYTPNANYTGADSFTYTVTSGGVTETATVTVNVTADNDAPTTTPVTLTAISEDSGTRLITQTELLANATDVDGPALTVTNLTISAGSGTLVDNGDGTWDYTPAANDDTSVSFTYTVTDGSLTAAGSATLDITPVNDAPVTNDDSAVVDEGQNVTINLVGNDADVENALDPSAITITAAPTNGSLVDNGDGTLTYTHDGSNTTSDSFSYTINDVSGATSNIATVSLTVNPANDNDTTDSTDPDPILLEDPVTDEDDDSNIGDLTYEAPAEDPLTKDEVVSPVEAFQTPEFSGDANESIVQIKDPQDEETQEIIYLTDEIDRNTQTEGREDDRGYTYYDNDLYKDISLSNYLHINSYAAQNEPVVVSLDDISILDFDGDDSDPVVASDDYDSLRQEIDESFNTELKGQAIKAKIVTVTAATFTVGIVSYLLRAGSLVASMMSALPLWRGFDPIAIFSGNKKKKKNKNEMSDAGELKPESIFDGDAE